MSRGFADGDGVSAATCPVEYDLGADKTARDRIVKRHFAVSEEGVAIHRVVLQHDRMNRVR